MTKVPDNGNHIIIAGINNGGWCPLLRVGPQHYVEMMAWANRPLTRPYQVRF